MRLRGGAKKEALEIGGAARLAVVTDGAVGFNVRRTQAVSQSANRCTSGLLPRDELILFPPMSTWLVTWAVALPSGEAGSHETKLVQNSMDLSSIRPAVAPTELGIVADFF